MGTVKQVVRRDPKPAARKYEYVGYKDHSMHQFAHQEVNVNNCEDGTSLMRAVRGIIYVLLAYKRLDRFQLAANIELERILCRLTALSQRNVSELRGYIRLGAEAGYV